MGTGNILSTYLPPMYDAMLNLVDVICEQYPLAAERVRIKRELLQKEQEEKDGKAAESAKQEVNEDSSSGDRAGDDQEP